MQEAAAAGTWAQGGAGCFLDILPLTEGTPVERRRVGAAPAPFLPAAPTAGAADGPFGPRRPPTVHWPDREGLGSGSGGFLRHAGPGTRAEGWRGSPGGQATLCQPSLLSASRCCGHQGSQPELVAARPLQHRLQSSEGPLLHPLPLPAPGGAQNTTSRPRSLPSLPLNPHLLHSAPCPQVNQGMVWLQMTSPPRTFADTPFGFLIGPERPCPALPSQPTAWPAWPCLPGEPVTCHPEGFRALPPRPVRGPP